MKRDWSADRVRYKAIVPILSEVYAAFEAVAIYVDGPGERDGQARVFTAGVVLPHA